MPMTPTLALQNWFGDSKVTNAEGLPLVVYRGEHGDTLAGALRTTLPGFTFTGDREVASRYAMEPNDRLSFHYADLPRVIPAYLSIKNPVFFNLDDPFVEFSDLAELLGRPLAEKMARKHDNHVRNTGNWEENFADQFATVDELLDARPDALSALYVDAYVLLDDYAFVEAARSAGFDGAGHLGNGESALLMEYRVFDRSQIQSAIGPYGCFDAVHADAHANTHISLADQAEQIESERPCT